MCRPNCSTSPNLLAAGLTVRAVVQAYRLNCSTNLNHFVRRPVVQARRVYHPGYSTNPNYFARQLAEQARVHWMMVPACRPNYSTNSSLLVKQRAEKMKQHQKLVPEYRCPGYSASSYLPAALLVKQVCHQDRSTNLNYFLKRLAVQARVH